ncbi:MAG: hypothetical protein JWP69_1672 [Flaviaesturariibacter sp.]|nr:hypothetical protein [Flaviaesturariibacter sp.]
MNYTLTLVFSLSILIAVVISWIRYKQIDPAYRPFLFLIWLSFANEILSIILAHTVRNNTINNNCFFLLESLLITWQFYKWKVLNKTGLYLLQCLSAIVWIVELGFVYNINTFCSYFIILHSFIIVLLSISTINKVAFAGNTKLLKNPIALICFGFIGYFTFSVLTEAFWVNGLGEGNVFVLHIYWIQHYINLFSNLIYALAILWMPAKPRFILLS